MVIIACWAGAVPLHQCCTGRAACWRLSNQGSRSLPSGAHLSTVFTRWWSPINLVRWSLVSITDAVILDCEDNHVTKILKKKTLDSKSFIAHPLDQPGITMLCHEELQSCVPPKSRHFSPQKFNTVFFAKVYHWLKITSCVKVRAATLSDTGSPFLRFWSLNKRSCVVFTTHLLKETTPVLRLLFANR